MLANFLELQHVSFIYRCLHLNTKKTVQQCEVRCVCLQNPITCIDRCKLKKTVKGRHFWMGRLWISTTHTDLGRRTHVTGTPSSYAALSQCWQNEAINPASLPPKSNLWVITSETLVTRVFTIVVWHLTVQEIQRNPVTVDSLPQTYGLDT